MDRCQRADYSIERRGYERDESRFKLIFRKSKTRSSTPSSYVYPVIPAGHCFRFDSTDEGGGAIEKAVRTSMAAARDSGSTRGNPRIDRQRRAAVDKQPRIPTYPALYPNWNSIFLTGLSLFLSSWNRPSYRGCGTRIETCPIFKGKI